MAIDDEIGLNKGTDNEKGMKQIRWGWGYLVEDTA
jgi:hypothetical protein